MDRHSLRRAELSWEGNTLVFTNYEDPTAPTAAYLTTLDGWYGGVGISAEATQRAVHHGQVAAKGQRTGRALTLGAQMYFEHERDRDIADRFVSGILQDGGFGELTYMVDGLEATAYVRLDGEVKHATTGYDYIELEVPLFAPNPYLFGKKKRITMPTITSGAGLEWDGGLFADGILDWGDSAPIPVATNDGNAPAWMTFSVSGEMDFGFEISIGRNHIVWPHHLNPNRDVIIDTGRGRVTQGGVDVTHMLESWDWAPIPPYSSVSPVFKTFNPHASGFCRAEWSDTYI